jgi:HTH DNA binding domain
MMSDLDPWADPDDPGAAWRRPWEDEVPARRHPAEPTDDHSLLAPLARAQDAIARLEARTAAAPPAVAEGLRARLAFHEAAGWLGHSHVWIHPQDLALRAAGLTGSYYVADHTGRLAAVLPASSAPDAALEATPSDAAAELALRFARLWQRLAEHRTWHPLADADAMRATLDALAADGRVTDAALADWLAALRQRDAAPALLRAGRAGRAWLNRSAETDPLGLAGLLLAACVWRAAGFGRPVSLPFWSAGAPRLRRLVLQVGRAWEAGFLGCVADAAQAASRDLYRLLQAAETGRALACTARSRLPAAVDVALRQPIVTARSLATALGITPQAALGLLRQLIAAGILREATGRRAWRAFVLA